MTADFIKEGERRKYRIYKISGGKIKFYESDNSKLTYIVKRI